MVFIQEVFTSPHRVTENGPKSDLNRKSQASSNLPRREVLLQHFGVSSGFNGFSRDSQNVALFVDHSVLEGAFLHDRLRSVKCPSVRRVLTIEDTFLQWRPRREGRARGGKCPGRGLFRGAFFG